MEKNKEMVLSDFIVMIKNSWTYDKMTYKEKDRLLEMLDSHMTRKALKGTYDNRWSVLQAIYHAYLIGIGYDNFNWREDNKEEKASF